MKTEAKLATLRHRMTVRSQYQTNVPPNNDTQIACLPDLSGNISSIIKYIIYTIFIPVMTLFTFISENLSNEKLLWEEIMKIKSMPVNMSQKRELKMKLLVSFPSLSGNPQHARELRDVYEVFAS